MSRCPWPNASTATAAKSRWSGDGGAIPATSSRPSSSRCHRLYRLDNGLRLRRRWVHHRTGQNDRRDRKAARSIDLDKRRVGLPADVESSWRWLVETAEANGSIVVPVAIPDTPPMLARMEEVQPGREALFWDGIDRLEQATGVPFVRVRSFGEWWGDGMARNFNHLSHEGARQFTRQLWTMDDFDVSALLEALDARLSDGRDVLGRVEGTHAAVAALGTPWSGAVQPDRCRRTWLAGSDELRWAGPTSRGPVAMSRADGRPLRRASRQAAQSPRTSRDLAARPPTRTSTSDT